MIPVTVILDVEAEQHLVEHPRYIQVQRMPRFFELAPIETLETDMIRVNYAVSSRECDNHLIEELSYQLGIDVTPFFKSATYDPQTDCYIVDIKTGIACTQEVKQKLKPLFALIAMSKKQSEAMYKMVIEREEELFETINFLKQDIKQKEEEIQLQNNLLGIMEKALWK